MDQISETQLAEIERRTVTRMVEAFAVDLSGLVLDMTNFATYIDSANERAPIAQRGHAKQKRRDLRLVGLGLVVSTDLRMERRSGVVSTTSSKGFANCAAVLPSSQAVLAGRWQRDWRGAAPRTGSPAVRLMSAPRLLENSADAGPSSASQYIWEICQRRGVRQRGLGREHRHESTCPTARLAHPDAGDNSLNVNLRGPVFLVESRLPYLKADKNSALLNVISPWAFTSAAGVATYSAGKAALLAMTRVMSAEYAGYGIRGNALAPGVIDTDTVRNNSPEGIDELGHASLLCRTGRPDEIVAPALLVCDAGSFITGQVLLANGGTVPIESRSRGWRQ